MESILISLFVIVVIILAIQSLRKTSINKDGRVPDNAANVEQIIKVVKEFKPIRENRLKDGYTEKSIENQLVKFLKDKYVSITQQHGIESKNARSIDIDVANGVAGLELKLAKNCKKTAELDRLYGQLEAYRKTKYRNDNLVLVVVGTKEESYDTILQDVQQICKKCKAWYLYIFIE